MCKSCIFPSSLSIANNISNHIRLLHHRVEDSYGVLHTKHGVELSTTIQLGQVCELETPPGQCSKFQGYSPRSGVVTGAPWISYLAACAKSEKPSRVPSCETFQVGKKLVCRNLCQGGSTGSIAAMTFPDKRQFSCFMRGDKLQMATLLNSQMVKLKEVSYFPGHWLLICGTCCTCR